MQAQTMLDFASPRPRVSAQSIVKNGVSMLGLNQQQNPLLVCRIDVLIAATDVI